MDDELETYKLWRIRKTIMQVRYGYEIYVKYRTSGKAAFYNVSSFCV